MNYKRHNILCGHYGSGKSNIAVNMALKAAAQGVKTALLDIDIVNPYFRSVDSRQELEQAGIRVICSEYANSNVDMPALPQEMYAVIDEPDLVSFIDVGGDDRGALALGRLRPGILKEENYEMLMVINRFRPLTRDAEATLEVLREIETAGGIRFTGLVHNSNLGAETSAETVLSSAEYAKAVSDASGLPVVMTAVDESIYGDLLGEIPDLFPMQLQKRPV